MIVRDFYSCCEKCGRNGHAPLHPEWRGDTQCLTCLPVRRRVNREMAEYILEKAMIAQGRLPRPEPIRFDEAAESLEKMLQAWRDAASLKEEP